MSEHKINLSFIMKLLYDFKKHQIVFLVVLLISSSVSGKTDYGIYSTYIDSVIYRLDSDDLKNGNSVRFRFPPIERGEEYSLKSIEAAKYKDNGLSAYGCSFSFNNPLLVNADTKLKLKCFAKNIDSLSIILKIGPDNNSVRLNPIRLDEDILYNCKNINLSNLFNEQIPDQGKFDYLVNEISIYCTYSENRELIINDLIAYVPVKVIADSEKKIINEVINSFPIIYQNQTEFEKEGELIPKVLNLFQKTNVDFLKYRIIKEPPMGDTNNEKPTAKEELEALTSSIRSMLIDYFENTENKKTYLLDEYNQLVLNSVTLDQFYQGLDLLLYKLNDNHFKLINELTEPSVKTVLPVYFYKLRSSIQVVSVLDSTLSEDVNLGDKLISINGKPIEDIIELLDKRIAGSTKHARETKILQKLLFYVCSIESGDLIIGLDGIEKGAYSITLTYEQINNNKNINIPPNIREKQKRFDFRRYDNIAYLKVGIFNEKILRPFFYSYVDSIMESNGLIIDLRNNPGGDLSGLFLFSFFINNPNVFFTFHNIGGYHETVMIDPDPYYNYTKPVVILVDARTTCSAEFFLDALTNARKDVISIGASKTAGSGQNVKYFDVPNTKYFRGGLQYRNSINYSATGKIIDEIGGFTPTVLTSFESYLDLAPYNDQLLNMALSYLEKSVTLVKRNGKKSIKLPLVFVLLAIAICITWLTMLIKFKKLKRVK